MSTHQSVQKAFSTMTKRVTCWNRSLFLSLSSNHTKDNRTAQMGCWYRMEGFWQVFVFVCRNVLQMYHVHICTWYHVVTWLYHGMDMLQAESFWYGHFIGKIRTKILWMGRCEIRSASYEHGGVYHVDPAILFGFQPSWNGDAGFRSHPLYVKSLNINNHYL